jgi:large subunit ribosomal protein L18
MIRLVSSIGETGPPPTNTTSRITMIATIKKTQLRQKRIWRTRKKITGTAERPRLCVHFSGKHIYAQAINDDAGRTLVFLSTLDKELKAKKLTSNKEGASALAREFAGKAKSAGITSVVFDRNGRRFHGTVKAFADAAREAGLAF